MSRIDGALSQAQTLPCVNRRNETLPRYATVHVYGVARSNPKDDQSPLECLICRDGDDSPYGDIADVGPWPFPRFTGLLLQDLPPDAHGAIWTSTVPVIADVDPLSVDFEDETDLRRLGPLLTNLDSGAIEPLFALLSGGMAFTRAPTEAGKIGALWHNLGPISRNADGTWRCLIAPLQPVPWRAEAVGAVESGETAHFDVVVDEGAAVADDTPASSQFRLQGVRNDGPPLESGAAALVMLADGWFRAVGAGAGLVDGDDGSSFKCDNCGGQLSQRLQMSVTDNREHECTAIATSYGATLKYVIDSLPITDPRLGAAALVGRPLTLSYDEECRWSTHPVVETPPGEEAEEYGFPLTCLADDEETTEREYYRLDLVLVGQTLAGETLHPKAVLRVVATNTAGTDTECEYKAVWTCDHFDTMRGGVFRAQPGNCLQYHGCLCVRALDPRERHPRPGAVADGESWVTGESCGGVCDRYPANYVIEVFPIAYAYQATAVPVKAGQTESLFLTRTYGDPPYCDSFQAGPTPCAYVVAVDPEDDPASILRRVQLGAYLGRSESGDGLQTIAVDLALEVVPGYPGEISNVSATASYSGTSTCEELEGAVVLAKTEEAWYDLDGDPVAGPTAGMDWRLPDTITVMSVGWYSSNAANGQRNGVMDLDGDGVPEAQPCQGDAADDVPDEWCTGECEYQYLGSCTSDYGDTAYVYGLVDGTGCDTPPEGGPPGEVCDCHVFDEVPGFDPVDYNCEFDPGGSYQTQASYVGPGYTVPCTAVPVP